MKDQNEGKLKKTWVAPEISVIQGLDSCVEFFYGTGGVPGGKQREEEAINNTTPSGI